MVDQLLERGLFPHLGYSINDTVVVYDRIRENRALMGKKTLFEELVNHSVNQSARRTIITTVTTVMAVSYTHLILRRTDRSALGFGSSLKDNSEDAQRALDRKSVV